MRKFCLVKSFIIWTKKFGECLQEECLGTTIPHSILVYKLLAIEIKTLFLKLKMRTSMQHESWTRMERGIFDSHSNPLQAFF